MAIATQDTAGCHFAFPSPWRRPKVPWRTPKPPTTYSSSPSSSSSLLPAQSHESTERASAITGCLPPWPPTIVPPLLNHRSEINRHRSWSPLLLLHANPMVTTSKPHGHLLHPHPTAASLLAASRSTATFLASGHRPPRCSRPKAMSLPLVLTARCCPKVAPRSASPCAPRSASPRAHAFAPLPTPVPLLRLRRPSHHSRPQSGCRALSKDAKVRCLRCAGSVDQG